jgi:capsular exopolysaccharide synthesis family protein
VGTGLRHKVILGLLVGLLLGLGAVFFLEYLDQTIKSAADIERTLGLPVLGLIPLEPKLDSATNGKRAPITVVSSLPSTDPAAEAYRALRTNVTFVGAEKPIQLLVVTSPGPAEGKSTTAANLALMLSRGGSRTLLIDADLRRPGLHRAFGLVQEPGLTDILVSKADVREAVRPGVAENLDLLPAGLLPPNPAELLGSQAMQQLLSTLRHEYTYILLDTPPTLPVTDATVAAAAADAAIVVMRSGETEEAAARRTIDQLARVRTRIAGIVLNGVSKRYDQHYSYYSRKYPYGRPRFRTRSLRSRLAGIM